LKSTTHMARKRAAPLAGILTTTALLAGLWWVIVAGRSDAWLVGVPAVAVAALVSARLGGGTLAGLSLRGLLGFITLFLRESLAGGLDVARRTLGRQLRIKPGFGSYHTRLQDPRARVLFINCISLLPGTLAADLDGEHVELHLLDSRDNPDPQLQRLEQAIARLFAGRLETGDA
jgi:multicomponent Na+:H+ antiporter subunit E